MELSQEARVFDTLIRDLVGRTSPEVVREWELWNGIHDNVLGFATTPHQYDTVDEVFDAPKLQPGDLITIYHPKNRIVYPHEYTISPDGLEWTRTHLDTQDTTSIVVETTWNSSHHIIIQIN
jgi:hypothetical protein